MSEKAHFIVNVLTDWPAIRMGAYVAISTAVLSAVGTIAGVYLGVNLSMKKFYHEKKWEKKYDIYAAISKEAKSHLISLLDFSEALFDLTNHKEIANYSLNRHAEHEKNLPDMYEKFLKLPSDIIELAFRHTLYINTEVEEVLRNCGEKLYLDARSYRDFEEKNYASFCKSVESIYLVLREEVDQMEKLIKKDLKI